MNRQSHMAPFAATSKGMPAEYNSKGISVLCAFSKEQHWSNLCAQFSNIESRFTRQRNFVYVQMS